MTIPAWETIDHPARWADIVDRNDIPAALEFAESHREWTYRVANLDDHPGHTEHVAFLRWFNTKTASELVDATLDPTVRQHVPAFDHYVAAGYHYRDKGEYVDTTFARVGVYAPDGQLSEMDRRSNLERAADTHPGASTRLRNLVEHREHFFAEFGPPQLRGEIRDMHTNPNRWGHTPAGPADAVPVRTRPAAAIER